MRQIAFAGIAIVWAFNRPSDTSPIELDRPFVWACFWFALCLLADLLQYLVSAAVWSYYARKKEVELKHQLQNDPDISPPREINWPSLAFYYIKSTCLVVGYLVIITHLVGLVSSR